MDIDRLLVVTFTMHATEMKERIGMLFRRLENDPESEVLQRQLAL